MKAYLQHFFEEFSYEKEDADFLTAAYDAIAGDTEALSLWQASLSLYDADVKTNFDVLLSNASRAGERVGVHPFTAELLMSICLSESMRKHYKKAGYSDALFCDTILDLRYKLTECKRVKGVIGSFVASWFSGFFDLSRVTLGRLQFEIIPFDTEYERDGKKIKKDTPVVNVHIPGSGEPLSSALCEDAYARAYAFFKDKVGKPFAFVCHSWLLFPDHTDFLPPRSNIRSFMARYDIFSSGRTPRGTDLWRLFDTDEKNPARLPKDSSLRRAYVEHLEKGGLTGYGHGLFFYEP